MRRTNVQVLLTTSVLLILPIYLIWEDAFRTEKYEIGMSRPNKVWISMSACFKGEEDTQSAATLMATRLWLLKTRYDVLVQIFPDRVREKAFSIWCIVLKRSTNPHLRKVLLEMPAPSRNC